MHENIRLSASSGLYLNSLLRNINVLRHIYSILPLLLWIALNRVLCCSKMISPMGRLVQNKVIPWLQSHRLYAIEYQDFCIKFIQVLASTNNHDKCNPKSNTGISIVILVTKRPVENIQMELWSLQELPLCKFILYCFCLMKEYIIWLKA